MNPPRVRRSAGSDSGWLVTVVLDARVEHGGPLEVADLTPIERARLREFGVDSIIVKAGRQTECRVFLESDAASAIEPNEAVALASRAIETLAELRLWPQPLRTTGPVRALWCAGERS